MPKRKAAGTRRVSVLEFSAALVGFVAFSILAGVLAAAMVLPGAAVAGAAIKGTIDVFYSLPAELELQGLPQASNIYYSDGETLIATFFYQNRVVVPLEEISPNMQKAVVAIEDKRFWEHHGVDGQGLLRALFTNVTTGETQGASTITQQLVKNTLINEALDNDDLKAVKAATEITIARKLGEARRALALEATLNAELGTECTSDPKVDCGKERILEQYLNMAQFGRSVYGVEAAAQLYFGKSAAELSIIEAATIAGITQNPYKWDPIRFPDNSEDRRNTVLGVMLEQEIEPLEEARNEAEAEGNSSEVATLDAQIAALEDEYQGYQDTPIEETLDVHEPKYSCVASTDAPFFCDYVVKVITKDPFFEDQGKEYLHYGVNIVTTLDKDMQAAANSALRSAIPPDDPTGIADALVALDPKNGHILAMAQNRDFNPAAEKAGETAINYSVDGDYGGSRGFSPGSTFKPIVLAEWLQEGHSLDSAISATSREWPSDSWTASCIGPAPFAGQKSWKPKNAETIANPQISVVTATAHSVNTSFAAMTNQLDLCGIKDMAEKLGFKRADGKPFEVVPSATLGSQNASPLTMATVGSTIANDGIRCEPRAILSISTLDGVDIPVPPDSCERAIQPEIADGVQYAMTQVISWGSGTSARLSGGRQAAGKTGTAQNNTHVWFLGFTPQIVAVVWVGHPDYDVPMQYITIAGKYYKLVYGGNMAAPIWKKFMDAALEGYPKVGLPAAPPAGLGWYDTKVPNVLGLTMVEAQEAINDAGFYWELDPVYVYNEDFAPGTVIFQSVPEGESLPAGQTIVFQITRNTLPTWWFTWPATWDPCVAPSDWWGEGWPPGEWGPPEGWSGAGCVIPEPTPSPSPSPSPSP